MEDPIGEEAREEHYGTVEQYQAPIGQCFFAKVPV
jgi:hypothetical protein